MSLALIKSEYKNGTERPVDDRDQWNANLWSSEFVCKFSPQISTIAILHGLRFVFILLYSNETKVNLLIGLPAMCENNWLPRRRWIRSWQRWLVAKVHTRDHFKRNMQNVSEKTKVRWTLSDLAGTLTGPLRYANLWTRLQISQFSYCVLHSSE